MWRQDMNYETQAATFFLSFLSLIAFHYHLQVTPSPPPCPVTSLSRPGVLVAYTLLRATGGRSSGSYLGTIWDIFGGSIKVFFERQYVLGYSEVNPMKYSLFHQPCMHQLQHPMQWSPVQLLHAISKQCPVHAMKCSQLKWRAIPEL